MKFVPLEDDEIPRYFYTRSEVLKKSREIMKGMYFKEMTLEDTNKISFITDDINFRELMHFFCEFSNEIDDVDDINIEGLDKDESKKYCGFWVIIFFSWGKIFPLSKRTKRKIGRLKD